MNDNEFPKTHNDFLELREYLLHLENSLKKFDPNNVSEDDLVSMHHILNQIEVGLTLSESYFSDNISDTSEAKSVLTKIFNKPIV